MTEPHPPHGPAEPPVARRASSRRPWLLLALLLLIAGVLLLSPGQPTTQPFLAAQHLPPIEAPEGVLAEVFELARPATLRIEQRLPGAPLRQPPLGTGTGFFIAPEGLVLTAYHVVQGRNQLLAVGPENQRYALTLLGFDAFLDLAVLQAEVPGMVPYLPLAPAEPRLGRAVVAIGNSRGDFLQGRAGRVTRLGVAASRINFASGTIELTAALAPGDSGGPVLTSDGEVVGVVSFISFMPDGMSAEESYVPPFLRGLITPRQFASYAVPVTTGSEVLADLRAGVRRDVPVIGFVGGANYDPLNPNDLDLGPRAGAIVREVAPNSPAARAGLRSARFQEVFNSQGELVGRRLQADVIVAIDGVPTRTFDEVLGIVFRRQIGEVVTLSVQRGDELLELVLTLGARAEVF
ncbi:MAG: serine protease [Truepera sp.]|nr:serine protease [Truepera sp.]